MAVPLGGTWREGISSRERWVEAEKKRLQKQSEEAVKYIATLEKKLANQGYVQHAPAAAVEADRTHLAETQDKWKRIQEQLAELQ